MALVKGTNSYVDVAEADLYFADRLDVTTWTNETALRKSQALITATSTLDELLWVGSAVSETQPLAFPRNGKYFNPKTNINTEIAGVIPSSILVATFELAYHLLNNANLRDDVGSVINLAVSGISLSVIRAPSRVPTSVKRIIKPLLLNNTNTWWRAN
jgi:hypothetical protein